MLSIVPRPLPALPTYPCTPIVVTFLLSANLDRIYLGHTVAIYPGDPLSPTPADNSFVVLVGSQAESCIALALHDDATRKVKAARLPRLLTSSRDIRRIRSPCVSPSVLVKTWRTSVRSSSFPQPSPVLS